MYAHLSIVAVSIFGSGIFSDKSNVRALRPQRAKDRVSYNCNIGLS